MWKTAYFPKEHLILAKHQHGFSDERSTVTLHRKHYHIQEGLNAPQPHLRSVIVALEMSKAFGLVNHSTLSRRRQRNGLSTTSKAGKRTYNSDTSRLLLSTRPAVPHLQRYTFKKPKIVGPTFDLTLTFNIHNKNTKNKMQSENKVRRC